MDTSIAPISQYAPTQPPSHRSPEFRKSQLIRQYASLLRSTPLILLFQHSNIKSNEWVGIRRELAIALRRLDTAAARASEGASQPLADTIKIQTLQTGLFAAALRLVEYYQPPPPPPSQHPTDPRTNSSSSHLIQNTSPPPSISDQHTHLLSSRAHAAVEKRKTTHPLSPLLSGPLAVLTFPSVSPQHLAAALSILSPQAPKFPAPKRRTNPGYHEAAVQGGLQKLLLLGARVEGKVFDVEGTRWVGGIDGGLEGLRAQIVALLQASTGQLVSALEAPGRSVYMTMEGRRIDLAGEGKDGAEEGQPNEDTAAETAKATS